MIDLDAKPTGIIATNDLVKEIRTILHDNGIEAGGFQEVLIMTHLMTLIVDHDEKLFNYAYKLGRASV